ncbi:MAG: SDR family NAD(P)-dependent oxidoreductase [Myxococcota bacterium]|nr:SDR family NAD(P)-dependent oxidoreductase [Myxococcota bacterium]
MGDPDLLSDGLEGHSAVVTGGSSGIGLAAAELLRAAGARVFVADLNAPPDGDGDDFLRTDVSDDDAVRALADTVLGRAGAPWVVVNAAGWDRIVPFVEADFAFLDRIVAINLLGCMKVTRAFLPAMVEAGGGKIVNVASDAGRVGSSGETAYAGAKGGIIAFTKSLARETARTPIHVNCVCPGPTDTPLFRSLPERLQQGLERAIPFRRLATPEEVAQAILWFASRRSDFVTGQTLSVSGGLTLAG